MFEKLNQAAEQMATGASRRQFLGRFGGVAAALAASVGALLAQPARAGGNQRIVCDNTSTGECDGLLEGTRCVLLTTQSHKGRCTRFSSNSTGCSCQ